MKFTKIPTDTFDKVQINAGFITPTFDPATGTGSTMVATIGGISFATNPEYMDFGDDIDNCPKNTRELKRLVGVSPTISGTMGSVDSALIKKLIGGADVADKTSHMKITPRMELIPARDFTDLWFVGDYSSDNSETTGKWLAVHLINAFNTAGFQWTTSDRGKGNFAFEFTGHMSITDQTTLPYEVYISKVETTGRDPDEETDEETNPNDGE